MVDSTTDSSFNEELSLKLITVVESFPCLYDKSFKRLNKYKRKSAWIDVSCAVGRLAEACKKRWMILRQLYGKELKMIRGSKGEHKSTWRYMQELSFLEPHMTTRGFFKVKKITKLTRGRPKKYEQEDLQKQKQEYVKKKQINEASKQTATTHFVLPKTIEEIEHELHSPTNVPSTKELGSLQQTVPCLAPRKMGDPANEHDEEYYFGMNIACKLRQMTPRNKALAQAEIRERLLQIEFGVPYTT